MRRLAGTRLPLIDDARPPLRIAFRIGFAVLCAAAALGAVSALEPVLSRPYYFPAFAAIILAAVVAGARYGMLATSVFAAGFAYRFLAPRGSFGVKSRYELASLAFYTLTGCVVAAIGGALRRAHAELREQHGALDKIHRQREDLLRAMTHDIRSPLNVIALNAALLSRTVGDRDPAARARALLISENVAAIDSMLRDLVDVAALESGHLALQPAAIDLAPALERIRASLAGALPVERVQVAAALGALPPVLADPRRLERVLVNLISNALKYAPGTVAISGHAGGGQVVVSVRDDGPGIAPDDLPHIFEKYYRASGVGSKEGLGLGLYISRLLVEAHGGRIWAESEAGRGSTFHVALPATARAAAPA